jgi:hypothetical protein
MAIQPAVVTVLCRSNLWIACSVITVFGACTPEGRAPISSMTGLLRFPDEVHCWSLHQLKLRFETPPLTGQSLDRLPVPLPHPNRPA